MQYNSFVNDSHGRLLDLILSNNEVIVNSCDSLLVAEDPHHRSIITTAEFVQIHALKPRPYTKYLYHNGDFDSMCAQLDGIDWHREFENRDIEEAVSFFCNTIYIFRYMHISKKISNSNN